MENVLKTVSHYTNFQKHYLNILCKDSISSLNMEEYFPVTSCSRLNEDEKKYVVKNPVRSYVMKECKDEAELET